VSVEVSWAEASWAEALDVLERRVAEAEALLAGPPGDELVPVEAFEAPAVAGPLPAGLGPRARDLLARGQEVERQLAARLAARPRPVGAVRFGRGAASSRSYRLDTGA